MAHGLLGRLLLGLGPDSQWSGRRIGPPRHSSRAACGPFVARPPPAVGSNPTVVRSFRLNKTGDAGVVPFKPYSHSSLSLLSPRGNGDVSSHGDRAERAGRHRRSLLAGVRARQRVSAPPSSRPRTEPRSRAPRATPASRSDERRPCS